MTILDHFVYRIPWRRGRYDTCVTVTEHHRIEVTTSPAGRTVHIHVDGKRWGPINPESTT